MKKFYIIVSAFVIIAGLTCIKVKSNPINIIPQEKIVEKEWPHTAYILARRADNAIGNIEEEKYFKGVYFDVYGEKVVYFSGEFANMTECQKELDKIAAEYRTGAPEGELYRQPVSELTCKKHYYIDTTYPGDKGE